LAGTKGKSKKGLGMEITNLRGARITNNNLNIELARQENTHRGVGLDR